MNSSQTLNRAVATRSGANASSVLQRREPTSPVAPYQHRPSQVLQTGRAPAQLSLFLRPGTAAR
jgi:hypothetical protein